LLFAFSFSLEIEIITKMWKLFNNLSREIKISCFSAFQCCSCRKKNKFGQVWVGNNHVDILDRQIRKHGRPNHKIFLPVFLHSLLIIVVSTVLLCKWIIVNLDILMVLEKQHSGMVFLTWISNKNKVQLWNLWSRGTCYHTSGISWLQNNMK
jgi:hypothetical protein